MSKTTKIAINQGGGYLPGLTSVLSGVARAATSLGWELVGIHDGFDGLLFPERYPDGGIATIDSGVLDALAPGGTPLLGSGTHSDPFRVRTINLENQVEEVDRSDDLLRKIRDLGIVAVISVVGLRPLSVLFRLHRKGLNSVCVPASVENDVAVTDLSFGFNTTLTASVNLLDSARNAAHSSRKIGVVEVLGEHTGWLALQSAIAVGADAVLLPETQYDIRKVAAKLNEKLKSGQSYGLVIVSEGAQPLAKAQAATAVTQQSLRASLSPLATGAQGGHVIHRSGEAAESVALELQRLTNHETYPLVLGQLVKGGAPSALDRQLGMGYGAAAVRAIAERQNGVMVSFQPPDLKFVPLSEAINKVRTIPSDSLFLETARSLGICLGD
jgi:6-phosphofructokinase 1